MHFTKVVLALDLVVLVRCGTEPSREEQSRAPQITVSTTESSPSSSALSDDTSGLADFPVSKSTGEILAAALRYLRDALQQHLKLRT